MKKLILIMLLCFTTNAFALTTYKGGQSTFPEPLLESAGQLIYEEMGCPICHGHQGAGDGFMANGLTPKPRDFTNFKIMSRLPDMQMYESIKNGIPDSAMPSWNLSEEQVWDVISYIKTFLADSQMTISICYNEERKVNLYNLDFSGNFKIEIDKPEYVSAKNMGNLLFIKPNDTHAIKFFKKTKRKVIRSHLMLSNNDYSALIVTRIIDCIK